MSDKSGAWYVAKYAGKKFIGYVKGPMSWRDAVDASLKLSVHESRMEVSYKAEKP